MLLHLGVFLDAKVATQGFLRLWHHPRPKICHLVDSPNPVGFSMMRGV